jgi:hypothetical protein
MPMAAVGTGGVESARRGLREFLDEVKQHGVGKYL